MRKRLMMVLAVVIACSVVFAACGNGGTANRASSSDETYDFIASCTLGAEVSPNWIKLFDKLQEESGGRLVTDNNIYWSGSLIPIPEIPKGLGSGAATISNIPSNNYPDVLPLSGRILQLPFLGLQDPLDTQDIYSQLLKEFPEMVKEFTDINIMPFGATTLGTYGMHFTDPKPVHLPGDLRGKKIIPYSLVFLPLLEDNNAAGSYIPPGQAYESLEKGVVDGYLNSYAFQMWFGLTELLASHTEFGEYGAYQELNILGMNLDFYNALPEDLQQLFWDIFINNGGNRLMWADTQDLLDNGKADSVARGDTIVTLTPEEIEVWKEIVYPEHVKVLDEICAQRGDQVAYDIYNRILELIAEKYGA